jgi:hypothetical protein
MRPEHLLNKFVVLILTRNDVRRGDPFITGPELGTHHIRVSQKDIQASDRVIFLDDDQQVFIIKNRNTNRDNLEMVYIKRPESFSVFDIELPNPY